MLKKLLIILTLVSATFTLAKAENYAVLITGDTPLGDAAEPKNWNGQSDSLVGSYDCFWNDTYLMWETLFRYGWKDENIFILFGAGVDFVFSSYESTVYDISENYNFFSWNLDHIID